MPHGYLTLLPVFGVRKRSLRSAQRCGFQAATTVAATIFHNGEPPVAPHHEHAKRRATAATIQAIAACENARRHATPGVLR